MDTMKPLEGLKQVGNVNSNWQSFKQRFELYIAAIGLDNKPDAITLLLTVAGPQAIEVFNMFEFDKDEDKDMSDTILEIFSAYCSPQHCICKVHVPVKDATARQDF